MDEVLLAQAVQIDGNASAEIQVFVKTKMSTSRDVDKEQITTKRIKDTPPSPPHTQQRPPKNDQMKNFGSLDRRAQTVLWFVAH